MTSLTHFWISSGVILAGSKPFLDESFGGSGVDSPLVSGDEVGGRWEVETVLSEDECALRREAVDSL